MSEARMNWEFDPAKRTLRTYDARIGMGFEIQAAGIIDALLASNKGKVLMLERMNGLVSDQAGNAALAESVNKLRTSVS